MTQGGSEKIPDRHRGQAVLFTAGFESNYIVLVNLNFGSILNQDNPLMLWNEFRQNIQKSRLATARSAANQNVLPSIT